MSELNPAARSLIDAASAAPGPSMAQRRAMKGAVMAAVLAPGAAAAAPALASHGVASVSSLGAGLKVTAVVIAVVGLGTGAAVVYSRVKARPPEARPALVVPVERPREISAEPAPVPEALAAPPPRPRARPQHPVAEPAAPADESLAEETELLSRAVNERSAGREAQALSLLLEYRRTFPHGVLATEARVVEVLTRCALDDAAGAMRVADELRASERANPAVRKLEGSCVRP